MESELTYTVIIPCYNCSSTIERAFQSVIQQTYKPKKIIVVDDGSTDGTSIILKMLVYQHSDFEVELYINHQNRGPSYSRNLGLKNSQTNLVAFLDADDEWILDKMAIQIDSIKKHEFDLIGTGYFVDNEATLSETKVRTITLTSILFSNQLLTPTLLIKSSVIREWFPEDQKYSEDLRFILKLMSSGAKAGLITKPLVRLGKKPYVTSGLSADLVKMELGEIKTLLSMFKYKPILVVLAISFSGLKFLRRVFIKTLMHSK